MGQDVLFEIFKGVGKLFLNPVFYLSFFFAAYLGVARVKRERKQFTVRAENAYFELRQFLKTGVIIGLSLSLLSVLLVLVIPMEIIIYIGVFTCLLSLIGKTRFLSPVYTGGLGILLSIFSLHAGWDFFLFSKSDLDSDIIIFPTAIILLGLLIVAEGMLVRRNGAQKTSPRLTKSARGQYIGVHLSERIWLVPLFLFIPTGILSSPIEGWPMFTVGDQTYSLLLVPFLLGFKQEVQGMHPIAAIRSVGKNTIMLGIVITLSAIGVYFYPPVAYASIVIAIIVREWITSRQKNIEKTKSFYFSRKNNGVMILGIVPESPADKMGLKIGELITKVNNIPVHDESELYKALQKNSAHCRIEVLDTRGENRFVQRALYEGDHHELGLLLIQDHKQEGNAAV